VSPYNRTKVAGTALWDRLCRYEREALDRGFRFVAGMDEAGRGPLAGPVVAAAVMLPLEWLHKTDSVPEELYGLRDSKQLTPSQRERFYDQILKSSVSVGVGTIGERVIDDIHIHRAALRAMQIALTGLTVQPDFLLLDAVRLSACSIPQQPIIKGDALSVSIAAASVVAKVTRDRLMMEYHRLYPQYNFLTHKGYGTPEHLDALRRYGPCEIHRLSFRGVAGTPHHAESS
jgi:ribonuclease HII